MTKAEKQPETDPADAAQDVNDNTGEGAKSGEFVIESAQLNASNLEPVKERLYATDEHIPGLIYGRGGVSTDDSAIVRPNAPERETEELLNNLIGECHFMMREVAFRSMCHSQDPANRVRFMTSAMEFAKTGAKIANTVARLRGGVVTKETIQKVIVERIEKVPGGEGGNAAR